MRKEYFQIGFGVTAITTALILVVMVAMTPQIVTDENLCPVGAVPDTHVIVLIDATDPRTPRQIAAMRERVEALREEAKRGDRLTLVELTEEPQPSPAFSKCSPGTQDECGIVEDCLLRDGEYRLQYRREMDRIVRDLEEQTTRPETPLLEVLRHLFEGDVFFNKTLVSPGIDGEAPNVRLLLFTDAVQYRPGRDNRALNFIARPPDFDAVAAAHPELVDVDMSRVSVEMLAIPRRYGELDVQTEALWRFWDSYFARTGARSYRRAMLPQ